MKKEMKKEIQETCTKKKKRFKYRIIKNSINANDYNTSFSISYKNFYDTRRK